MRREEAGFTLVEMVVAVAIAVMLLAAGGVWMLSMRPGALAGATDDFDSALAAARQVAATSGNGATMAFVPRTDGAPGFRLRVYAGRPTAANAVTATNLREVDSTATVTEATLGSPPFAIFLSSGGYPTGKASYPSVDASSITFPAVATQPPCPAGGIVLTFHSVQGPTTTRSLRCNVVVSGNAAPDPSPTPNVPHIMPPLMVAHWTNDRGGALKFSVAEFGYTGAFSKADSACDAIATFAANPVTPRPASNPDEPVAAFELYPIPGSPGVCTVSVADSYGQTVRASVQIMGDLRWLNAQPSLSMQYNDVLTLQFGKTFDSEPLKLQAGGNCGGVVTVTNAGGSTQPSSSTAPTTAQLTITALAPGACVLVVGDQYGEPTISIPINVTGTTKVIPAYIEFPLPPATTITWPPVGFSSVGYRGMSNVDERIAKWVNTALGGGVAAANGAPPPGTQCYAIAFTDSAFTVTDGTDDSQLGTVGGCWEVPAYRAIAGLTGTGSAGAVLALGYNGEAFSIGFGSCGPTLNFSSLTNNGNGPAAYIGEYPRASASPACMFYIGDQAKRTPTSPVGVRVVNSISVDSWGKSGGACTFIPSNTTFRCSGSEGVYILGYESTCQAIVAESSIGDTGPVPIATYDNVAAMTNPPTTQAGWSEYLNSEIAAIRDAASANGYIAGAGSYVDTNCP